MTAPTVAPPSMQERLAAAEQRSAYLQGQLDARGQSQPAPQSQGRPPLSGCANGPQGRAVGNSALRTGAIVAGGAVAASVVGLAPVLVVAGVAVGVKMLVDKTRAALQRRQDRRVAQGGQRHGVGGALTRWAGQNKGPLAAGVGVGAAMLMTGAALLPAVAVGAAAVGLAKLVRGGLRARRERQQYRADLEYLRNLPGRNGQQAETAPRADPRSVGTETPAPTAGSRSRGATERMAERFATEPPMVGRAPSRGARHRVGTPVSELAQRPDIVNPRGTTPVATLRSAVSQAGIANPLQRQGNAVIGAVAAPGSFATVGGPPVAPVGPRGGDFMARRAAQLNAEQVAAPAEQTPAVQPVQVNSVVRRGQAARMGLRQPPGAPRTPGVTTGPAAPRGGSSVRAA